jgi:hypothetical protein
MLTTSTSIKSVSSELPLAAVAATEVRRLRSVRAELVHRRAEIDRELKAVDGLIATYVAYKPGLADGDRNKGRARNLGLTLTRILAERPAQWLGIPDLRAAVRDSLPGIEPTDTSLRNALYHLVRTERIESRQTDSGIQYRLISDLKKHSA